MKQIDTTGWILALLGLLCLMPFIQPFHEAPISSLFSEWLAFLLLWAALLIASFHGKGISQPIMPKVALVGILLIVFAAIQFAIRPPEYAQQIALPICYFISFFGAIQLGYWLRQRDLVTRSILWVAGFFVFGAAYTVAVQFLQLSWPGYSHMPFMMSRLAGHNPYGNIGQTNHVASYLAIGWASANYLLSRRVIRLRFYLPFSFLLFAGLVLTGQRSGFIYVVCLSLLFWYFSAIANSDGILRRRSLWICGMPLIYLLLNYLLPVIFGNSGSNFISASQRLNSGWEDRLNLLKIGWSLFSEAPWFGIGWGKLASYQFLRADVLPTMPANNVHNIVVQLFAETGILFAVTVIAIVLLWLSRFIKFPPSREKQFVMGVVVIVGLHSLVEYPLWYAYFLLPIGVLAGMFELECILLRFRPALVNVMIKGASAVAVGVLFYSFFEALYVTDMYNRREYLPYSDVMRAEEVKEISQMPSQFFLKPYIEYIDSTGRIFSMEYLREDMEINQRLLNTLISNNVVVRRSIYLAMDGHDSEAKTTFLKMKKIFPGQAPQMLKVVKHAAAVTKNDNLTVFSKWAVEVGS